MFFLICRGIYRKTYLSILAYPTKISLLMILNFLVLVYTISFEIHSFYSCSILKSPINLLKRGLWGII